MRINLTNLTIDKEKFDNKHGFNNAIFWHKALNPRLFKADNVGYDLHKKACIKFGYSITK